MLDVLFSFLLFLAASALIIAYFVLVYAVLCALWHGWMYYENEFFYSHTEEQVALKFGSLRAEQGTFLWWLISRFLALPAAAGFAVLFIHYKLLEGHAKTVTDIVAARVHNLASLTVTDIVAARVHNLASFLEVFVFLLLLALYVYRVEKSNEYPDFSDYFRDRKFLCGIAALFAVLFALYMGGLFQWLPGETVHKRAKLYFVAGESLNSFRRLLPGHTDDWKKLPLKALQKVAFNRAARLLPDDDGETAAWENRWFWSHYGIGFGRPGSSMDNILLVRGQRYTGRNPGARGLLDNRWRCLEDMDAKPIRDPKVRRKLYMLEYPQLAWAVSENIDMLVPKKGWGDSDESRRIHRMTFEEYGARLAPRLVRLVEEWRRTPENRALIATHPKAEALGLVTLTLSLESAMKAEIRSGDFRCENDSVRQYLAARRQFFEPETGTAAYLRVAVSLRTSGINITDSNGLRTFATEWQHLAQYVLEQRCGLQVPGRIVTRDCRHIRENGDAMALAQCLEENALVHCNS